MSPWRKRPLHALAGNSFSSPGMAVNFVHLALLLCTEKHASSARMRSQSRAPPAKHCIQTSLTQQRISLIDHMKHPNSVACVAPRGTAARFFRSHNWPKTNRFWYCNARVENAHFGSNNATKPAPGLLSDEIQALYQSCNLHGQACGVHLVYSAGLKFSTNRKGA
jgi:hypothetical protein